MEIAAYRSFSEAVRTEEFSAFVKDERIRATVGNAFAFCAQSCVAKVTEWAKAQRGFQQPFEFVSEHGDEGMGLLTDILYRHGHPLPIFKPKTPSPEHPEVYPPFTPLQAADFIAYEHLKALKQVDAGAHWEDLRQPLKILAEIPQEWGLYTEENLAEFVKNAFERTVG